MNKTGRQHCCPAAGKSLNRPNESKLSFVRFLLFPFWSGFASPALICDQRAAGATKEAAQLLIRLPQRFLRQNRFFGTFLTQESTVSLPRIHIKKASPAGEASECQKSLFRSSGMHEGAAAPSCEIRSGGQASPVSSGMDSYSAWRSHESGHAAGARSSRQAASYVIFCP